MAQIERVGTGVSFSGKRGEAQLCFGFHRTFKDFKTLVQKRRRTPCALITRQGPNDDNGETAAVARRADNDIVARSAGEPCLHAVRAFIGAQQRIMRMQREVLHVNLFV